MSGCKTRKPFRTTKISPILADTMEPFRTTRVHRLCPDRVLDRIFKRSTGHIESLGLRKGFLVVVSFRTGHRFCRCPKKFQHGYRCPQRTPCISDLFNGHFESVRMPTDLLVVCMRNWFLHRTSRVPRCLTKSLVAGVWTAYLVYVGVRNGDRVCRR